MNNIDIQVKKIHYDNRIGIMTHVIIGFPTIKDTIAIVKTMEQAGVDFIELQIPFSDPIADGPTIMTACEKALNAGVTTTDALSVMETLSKNISIPLLFMAYYNTIFKYGVKNFCEDAKKAGASGLIVPDMPIEEEQNEHFHYYCNKTGLYNIRVISPASTIKRVKLNAELAQGFLYCTARQGTTGTQKGLDPKIMDYLSGIKKITNIPLAVGFGISKKEHIQMITPYADIGVIGSAIIEIINKSNNTNLLSNVENFLLKIYT